MPRGIAVSSSKGISTTLRRARLSRSRHWLTTIRESQASNGHSSRNLPRLRHALTKASWAAPSASSRSPRMRYASRVTARWCSSTICPNACRSPERAARTSLAVSAARSGARAVSSAVPIPKSHHVWTTGEPGRLTGRRHGRSQTVPESPPLPYRLPGFRTRQRLGEPSCGALRWSGGERFGPLRPSLVDGGNRIFLSTSRANGW